MKKELSLYIHIPFCNSKCNYCNFVSSVGTSEEKQKYVECLKKEIAIRGREYGKFYNVRTIYIGGGTPSSLDRGAIKDILNSVYRSFTVKNNAEITIELNPNTVTPEKLEEYVLSGVNRFSIGLQCISGNVLKNMGRTHTLEDFEKTINLIRDRSMSNINADIIVGYPGQTLEDVVSTVKYLVAKNIPHISTYMLSVEEGTKLKVMVDKGLAFLPSEEKTIKMYQKTTDILNQNGYSRYEISNFAKPGFMCKHNLVYWKREDYLGLGTAAHSYIDHTRFSNTESTKLYCDCILEKGKAPVDSVTKLTKEEEKEEFIMLSLRTKDGLILEDYKNGFKENFLAKHKEKIASFIKLGLLVISKEGNIRATDKGFLVLNKIIVELCS